MAIIEKNYDTLGRLVPALHENLCGLYAKDTNWMPAREIFPDWRGNSFWMYKNDAGECLLFFTLTEENNFPVRKFIMGPVFADEEAAEIGVRLALSKAKIGEENAEKFPIMALMLYQGILNNIFEPLAMVCKKNLEDLFDLSCSAFDEAKRCGERDDPELSTLNIDQLHIIKFLLIHKPSSDYIFNPWFAARVFRNMGALKPGWFERFGISDKKIEDILRWDKISATYLLSMDHTETPVASYFYSGGEMHSYLTESDEVYCWRNHTAAMKSRLDAIRLEIGD